MLFVLDASLSNIDENNIVINRGLETLLSAFQRQDHMLFCEMNDFRTLRNKIWNNLGLAGKSALNSLYNKLPEYKSLVDSIDYKVIVYNDNENRGMYREEKKWHVPIKYFADSGLIQTALLGENVDDAKLYFIFAELFIKKNKINGFLPKARLLGGNGSGIPEALASYLRSERSPCFCLTDSDKYHPGFSQSVSSRRCGRIADIDSRVVSYFCLEEREVENIIPIPVLEKVVDTAEFMNRVEPFLRRNSDIWKYFDLKSGLSLDWIGRQDIPTKDYWSQVADDLIRNRRACIVCDNGQDNADKKCTCGMIAGFGEKILSNSIQYLTDTSPRINLRLMESDSRWEKIGKLVFDFCVAPVGERVAA